MLDAAESLENSLCVIDAIDAHAEQGCFDTQLFAQSSALCARNDCRINRGCAFRECHADGVRPYASDMTLTVHGKAVPFGKCFDSAFDRTEKIVAMRLDVKTDEVGS